MDNSFNAIIDSIKKYFRGVRAEWGKITWPEKNQVVMETIFVIAIVTAFTVAVYLTDLLFKYSVPAIAKLLSNF
jgi:preprotein translocase subunit SecE